MLSNVVTPLVSNVKPSTSTESATVTSSKLLVSDKLTVIFDKSVLYVATSSIVSTPVYSTTLTSVKLTSAASLTGERLKLKVDALDVAVLPEVRSWTIATILNDTSPL